MWPGRGVINLERKEKRSHPDGESDSDRTGERMEKTRVGV